MPDLNRILTAKTPLTLSSLPRGAVPLIMGDFARAVPRHGGQRAVFIAPDDAAMKSAAEAARFFAPEVEVIEFPAWDCLPYDRASPALSVSAARLSALFRLQRPAKGSQLLVTTVNAVLQRVLTPFRIRESVREFRPGTTIGHDSLAALLTRQGYSRTDTVVDHGEFAVRGSIVDIFPSSLEEGCGSISSAMSSKACACSIRPRSVRPERSARTCCSPRPRRCSTRTASSGSVRATANCSARPRRRIRFTKR